MKLKIIGVHERDIRSHYVRIDDVLIGCKTSSIIKQFRHVPRLCGDDSLGPEHLSYRDGVLVNDNFLSNQV